ncbi:MAG: Trm112 family protein [Deltaproteobacteria bacterium]|nr:Trm112 family protein [Deltaproteobacteria bacterium]
MEISKELLEVLACPKCKGDLESNTEENKIICYSCHVQYPIKSGIPVMLIDEAKPLS